MIYNSLNSRQDKILKALINNSGYINGDNLSKLIEISKKTLQKEIPILNDFLIEYGCSIVSARGIGYKFECKNNKSFKLLSDKLKKEDTLIEEKESRINSILSILAFSSVCYGKGSVKIEELSDKLYVSSSTIKNDIKEAKSILKKYDLNISRSGNSGINLIGTERKIRGFISEFLVKRYNNNYSNEINMLFGYENDYFTLVAENVLKTLEKFSLDITDLGFNNLCTHILITIYRIRSNKIVGFDVSDIDFKEEEYNAAIYLKNLVENSFNVKFPKSEIIYLYQHLIAQKRVYIDKHVSMSKEDNKILEWIKECNENINNYTGIDFNMDETLCKGLLTHLTSAFNRIDSGMKIKNFMLNDIKINYPFAFEIATYFSKTLSDLYKKDIDENEIGFIAMHFGGAIERLKVEKRLKRYKTIVVCATGVGTSILLKSKLESKFNDILEIVGFYPAFKLKAIDLSKVDFIISTIPLEINNTKVIQVSPILLDEDCNKINSFLRYKNYNINEQSSLFKEDLIFKDLEFKNNIEAINFLSSKLLELGYIDKTMKDSYIERENIGTTEIGNLVAIPHGMQGEVYKEGVALGILKDPMKWNCGQVQLIVMLCIRNNDIKRNEKLFLNIYKNLNSKEKVMNIIQSSSLDELLNINSFSSTYCL